MGAIASSNQMILTKKINCIVKRYLAERIFAKYPRADFNALSALRKLAEIFRLTKSKF